MSFDMQPVLTGERVVLRPLEPGDWPALYEVASDPLIWEQHPANDRWREPVFRAFFDEALATGSAFAVLDPADGSLIGSTRYHGWDPDRREVEIGWTFLARSRWRTGVNAEMKRLMLAHAFGCADSVLFFVGPENRRSRAAVERIGGVLEGSVERFGRESVVYRIRKADWEARQA